VVLWFVNLFPGTSVIGTVSLFAHSSVPLLAVRLLYSFGIGGRLVVLDDKGVVDEDVRIIDGDLVIMNDILENLP
jgi:hypothetical protein